MANALTSTAILIPQPPAALAVIMPALPPNKASRKKNGYSPTTTSSNELARLNKKAGVQSPAFPLVAFFWPARKSTSQWLILPLVLMFVGLFRWCAGLWGYSGTDPLFNCDSLPYLCQASRLLRCTVTTKPRGIGWRSRHNCLYHSGTSTTYSTGV